MWRRQCQNQGHSMHSETTAMASSHSAGRRSSSWCNQGFRQRRQRAARQRAGDHTVASVTVAVVMSTVGCGRQSADGYKVFLPGKQKEVRRIVSPTGTVTIRGDSGLEAGRGGLSCIRNPGPPPQGPPQTPTQRHHPKPMPQLLCVPPVPPLHLPLLACGLCHDMRLTGVVGPSESRVPSRLSD